jgi:hypothetical protein
MIILLFVLAFFIPRLSIIILWLFSSWFSGVFNNSIIWPILGFIFMPASLLWYSIVYNYFDNSWTFIPILGLIVAVLIDFSPARARKRYKRRNAD